MIETDLHLPGYLQGEQYEYSRHVMRPIEWAISTYAPILPLIAYTALMTRSVEQINKGLALALAKEGACDRPIGVQGAQESPWL